jgi:hypothetical protein
LIRLPVPSAVARGSVCDGLLVCLALLGRDHERFERAAVVWHSRWCAQSPGVGFAESRAALDALESLAGFEPDRGAAVQALRAACSETEGVEEILDGWLAKGGDASD